MAELKMKRLRLLVLRERYEQLMQELILRRCVEFSPLGEDELEAGTREQLSPEQSRVAALAEKLENVERALELLEKYKPASRHLRLKKPELEERVLLNDTGMNFALHKAERLLELGGLITGFEAEEKQLQTRLEQLKAWTHLDAPLGLGSVESVKLLVGSLPLRADVEKLEKQLEELDEKSELFELKEDKKLRYIALLCMKERAEEMLGCLKSSGFVRAPETPGMTNAANSSSGTAGRIKECQREAQHNRELIAQEHVHMDALMLAADRLRVQLALAGAEESFLGTEKTLLMAGRFPAGLENELTALFEAMGCAYEMLEPDEAKKGFLGIRQTKPSAFCPLEIKARYHKLTGGVIGG